ncbi:MAG TPA: hypothetical protein VMW47_08460 [Verrucomicrobiae bacterium]|nr:hypothetical protein [Verrucomicrobiae bacterium]
MALIAGWLQSPLDRPDATAQELGRVATAAPAAPRPWIAWAGAHGERGVGVGERGYSLRLRSGSDRLQLLGPGGITLRTLALAALIGRRALPEGTRFIATTWGAQLTVTAVGPGGLVLEAVIVRAWPSFFTVRFLARLGPDRALLARFFTPEDPGMPAPRVLGIFTPNGRATTHPQLPSILLGIRPPAVSAPFAPPPFDLELPTRRRWVGLGLVQVPDATQLALQPDGSLGVNYPLGLLAGFPDAGAGGRVPAPSQGRRSGTGRWLRFPAFVVTTATGALAGLAAYHSALVRLGAAPVAAPPGTRPRWWTWPIADTWGQQRATGAAWGSPSFTAAWVRSFVASWRRQVGIRHFTVVIDSRWQAAFDSPVPSRRFGGVAGMRRLIAQLHAEGVRVLLWWPLWARGQGSTRPRLRVDPTSLGFPTAISRAMRVLVGTGPRSLGADGIKLDWGYHVPQQPVGRFARPRLGVGAAALLRYMTQLSQSVWRADPHALVDASAVAPQFGGTEDAIRLYDAGSNQTWNQRALIVSQVDPSILIDGDGWRLPPSQAVVHVVSSSVYGIPTLYFATRWAGGSALGRPLARSLGAVMRLAAQRGQGRAVALAAGGFGYVVRGRLTARTLARGRGLEVIRYGACKRGWRAQIVSLAQGWLRVPLPPSSGRLSVLGPRGAPATWRIVGRQLRVRVRSGDRYVVAGRGGRC